MNWDVKYTQRSRRQLRDLDRQVVRRIENYMKRRVAVLENPRQLGHALSGPWGGYWRYRVGDYRVICNIQDSALTILVVEVGGRDDIYC